MHRIGIDLGGTKIEGIVLDAQGHTLFRERIPTRQEEGYEAILDRIAGLYRACARHADPVHTFGMGTPGAISTRTGWLKNSNTVCLNGRPVAADLERRMGRALAIENDANCFAMAEAMYGAGRGHGWVFGVILGTGCGGGLVVDGAVRRGPQSIAGEWGHMSIDPAGPVCYCGNRGCVETLISGGGLERMWRREHGEERNLRDIVAGYRAGGVREARFMETFFDRFGRALANLIDILDPDAVILGGGVSNIDELYAEGVAQVDRYVFSDGLETPILRHAIGDSAGVIGAALIGVTGDGKKPAAAGSYRLGETS